LSIRWSYLGKWSLILHAQETEEGLNSCEYRRAVAKRENEREREREREKEVPKNSGAEDVETGDRVELLILCLLDDLTRG